MSFGKIREFISKTHHSGRLWNCTLFIFIIAVCFYKAFKFSYPNFIFTYPFISYDGYQWISDSLHYYDSNIDITHRNPALPIIFAFLKSISLLDQFPFVISLLTVAFYLSCYWLLRGFYSRAVATLTIFWFFFVFRIHNFFDYVLADPWCLILTTVGIGSLLRALAKPKYLMLAATSFALALNFQFAPAFASPALIWFVFRGFGWSGICQNKRFVAISVAIFLVLLLPQFVYKWIAFGSPLYSHVIHFPLLRIHFYGLPYYFVNFFAFLGWPLALVVLYGFKTQFSNRSLHWQLVHLYGLSMFVFWIVSYLWLDVRFLLYFLPAWILYGAQGIQSLNLMDRLSFRKKTIIEKFAIAGAVYLGISLAAVKTIAFDAALLPVFPQISLRLSSAPITQWGVGALTTEKLTTEYQDTYESMFNLSSHFKFYRGFARSPRAQSHDYIKDVIQAGEIVQAKTTSKQAIGVSGEIFNVFETKMKVFFTLGRNLAPCSGDANYCLGTISDLEKKTFDPGNSKEIWRGKELVLFSRGEL